MSQEAVGCIGQLIWLIFKRYVLYQECRMLEIGVDRCALYVAVVR